MPWLLAFVRRVPWLALVLSLHGCGSKTGLEVPPAEAVEPARAPAAVPCVVAPPEAEPVTVQLRVPVELAVVDLFFLVDATGSMVDEISNVRRRLRDFVVPSVTAEIPDPAFGLGLFGEFPRPPHGPADIEVYQLSVPVTRDVSRIEGALTQVPQWGNDDFPEAQIEALYQVVTGAGLDPFVPSTSGCPSGGWGGACFREDALPVVMLITDAPFHNGPPGVRPISPYRLEPAPHGYSETVDALLAEGILVVGLGASDPLSPSPMAHLRALALDTGSVDEEGRPLAFDIGGDGGSLGQGIIDAIKVLAGDVPLDVDAFVVDTPRDPRGADIVRGLTPVRAEPSGAVGRMTSSGFERVEPGTLVVFALQIDASGVPVMASAQRFEARVAFRAFGRSVLAEQRVEILVPGTREDASCPAP